MATAGRYTGEQVTELFSFQFLVSSVEIFEKQEENHHLNVTAIVFQLFDFPPVMIISKTFQLASNDRQVHSSCPKTVLRGGKTCLFKIPSSKLKSIGDSSRLKVMLAKVEENSNSADAIAASEVNLKDFVAALFANEECCVKRRYDIDVFDHSKRPFARLRLKLSLRLVDQLQGEQKPNTSKIERYTVITDPPPLIFTARPPDSSFSGCNGNTFSDSPLPSQTQTCPPDCSEQLTPGLVCTDKQHFIVWPNGYVEERSKPHSVVRQPPDDKSNDGGYVSEDGYIIGNSKFPLLEALYSELSMMRMRAAGNLINDPSAAFSQKVLLDKCLQTDSQAEATTGAQVSRKKKEESTKNFTRTCCKQMDNGLFKQPVRHPQVKTSATPHDVEEDTPTVGRDKKPSMTGKATLCSLSVDPPILAGPANTNPVHSSACTPSLTHHNKSTSPSSDLHATKLSTVDSLNHKSPNMPVHEHPSIDTKIPKTVHSNGQTRINQPSVMSDPVSCSISTIQGNMVSNETPRRESSITPTSDSLENSRAANSALGESSPALYSSDFEDEVKTEESHFSPSIDADSLDSSSED